MRVEANGAGGLRLRGEAVGQEPELICFDCDGVLVDSELLASQVMAACLAEFGVDLTPDEIVTLFTGKSAADAKALIHDTFGVDLPASYQARYDRLLFESFRERLQPVPGIAGTLAQLQRPSCVTSNSGHARLALTLDVTGLAGHFGPHVFSAEDVARGKPAPDLFFLAARRMGVDVQRCLVIDDSVAGIAGAVAAGARAIGFAGGAHIGPGHAARLEEAGACCVVDTAQELIALCT